MMKVNEAKFITELEVGELSDSAKKVHFKSLYRFLNHHNGFRPMNMHIFLGTSGGGKSTMVRSLIVDVLARTPKGKKVLMWLSEESTDEFIVEIAKTGLISHGRELFTKMDIISEQEMENSDPKAMISKLNELMASGKYGFLFFDNITTSEIYMDRSANVQALVAKKIKAIIQKANVPAVLIAHTGAQVTDTMNRMIESNDIRGSKTIINLSQFIYILQTFYILKKRVPTLRTIKHRGQLVEENIFQLNFNKETFIFDGDRALDFKDFKEIFKARNVL